MNEFGTRRRGAAVHLLAKSTQRRFVTFFILFFGFFCRGAYLGASQTDWRNGQSALAFRVDWKSNFTLGARLSLPRVTRNRGQYCIWIMIAELKGTYEYPAMVQSGLFRWKPNNFALQPFVATEHSRGRIKTTLLPLLSDDSGAEHELRISRQLDNISINLDGRTIFNTSWTTFFKNAKHLYVKIASEVSEGGDEVSGTVRDITLTTPDGVIKPYLPTIADEDRGATFVCKNHVFVATGTFDSSKRTEARWFRPPLCEHN